MNQEEQHTISEVSFSNVFDLEEIQFYQDLFSDVTGIGSIITHPDGTVLTRPSNFCKLCREIIRNTEVGKENCCRFDASMGNTDSSGPVIKKCYSAGLWHVGISIIVEEMHVANWIMGQVRTEEIDIEQAIIFSKEIGADPDEYLAALDEVIFMSKERFEKIARILFVFVNGLSSNASKNIQLKKSNVERHVALKELEHEQNLFNNLMNYLTDHIYFKDKNSRFIRVNKSLARYFKLDNPGEVIGKTDFDIFTKEHADQAFNDEMNVINTGEPITIEEKETWSDHPNTWMSTTKLPLRDKDNRIIGSFGISRDITERKRIQNELADERNFLKTVIENIPDRFYAKDIHGKITTCNIAAARRLGRKTIEEIIGKTSFDLLPEEISLKHFSEEQEIIRSGKPVIDRLESWVDNDKKETIWSLISKVPFRDKQGNIIGIIGIGKDITAYKKAEEEIVNKNLQLQSLNAEKDKLFSIIAHDLRGPLGSFVAVTQILFDEIPTMNTDELRSLTESMKISATSIYGLLENLLDWSRLRRGQKDFLPTKLFIKSEVDSCLALLMESADNKKLQISTDINPDLIIYADKNMFETILRNLISNAIKFTHIGGNIYISAGKGNLNKIELKIVDSGIGMSADLIKNLFLISERTNRLGTNGEPSTGLGLFLVKEFVDKHNGTIRVESTEGKGSAFYLYFPV
jgi:two-component system, sensor histidine kinase and response regulator